MLNYLKLFFGIFIWRFVTPRKAKLLVVLSLTVMVYKNEDAVSYYMHKPLISQVK